MLLQLRMEKLSSTSRSATTADAASGNVRLRRLRNIPAATAFISAEDGARRLQEDAISRRSFTDREEVLNIVEKAILLFRERE